MTADTARPSPERPGNSPRTLLAVALVLFALALVPIVVLGPIAAPPPSAGSPRPSGSLSGASPAPSATSTPTTLPPSASPIDVAALERDIARIEGEVVAIRMLRPLKPVVNRLVSPDEFVAELKTEFERGNPGTHLHAETVLYERLGFVDAGSDLEQLVLAQLGQGVAGYYRPDRKDMTIIRRSGGFGPLERQVLAHEYTHALQDQHFMLSRLALDDLSNSDRALAERALVEGDAVLVQAKWSEAHLSPSELTDVIRASDLREQARIGSGLPPVLLRQAAFPYLDGLFFVTGLEASGGWAAVNRAFARPPASTEQVLHPEKYRTNEAPAVVRLPPLAAALGGGWHASIEDTFGEVDVQVWTALANGPTLSRRAAAGWGGDRIASYDGPSGAWAVLWETRWDTSEDASEFAIAARAVASKLSARGDVLVDGGSSHRVRVLFGSDDAVLNQLRRALGTAH